MSYPKAASLTGYQDSAVINGASRYKPYNGALSGSQGYAPWAFGAQVLTLTFSAAPADTSQLIIPEGPPNNPGTPSLMFTYTYGGSPGSGVIPLVSGGGTAAQAATATVTALLAQPITKWTPTNPSAGVVQLRAKQRGVNLTAAQIAAMLSGTTHITITQTPASQALVVPGSAGRVYSTMPG